MLGDFDEDEIQDHECDGTNIAVAPDGRQYCAHCGWRETVKHEADMGLCHGGSPHYCPNCDRSFKAIASAHKLQAWQPIETAPKDGTRIMAIDGRHLVAVAKWVSYTVDGEERGGWLGMPGIEPPTFWMPLPAPPKERQQ